VPSAELPRIKQQFPISASTRRSDGVHVRIVTDVSPAAQAIPAVPSLEDAYLYCLSRQRAGVAA
jgi:hypothetical protein